MGLLSWLKDAGNQVSNTLASEVAKFKNQDAVNASLAVVALVAGADGEVEPEERKAAVNYIKSSDLFAAFDRTKLASTLEGYYSKSTDELVREDLFDIITKVKNDSDTANRVIKVGIAIANADGEFEPEEKDVLLDVVNRLGLDKSRFKQLAA